jgi:hypothetical protein
MEQFTSRQIAAALGLTPERWDAFYQNAKAAKLLVLRPRGRGETFDFSAALECAIQLHVGARHGRDLAQAAFAGVVLGFSSSKDEFERRAPDWALVAEGGWTLIFPHRAKHDQSLVKLVNRPLTASEAREEILVGSAFPDAKTRADAERECASFITVDLAAMVRRLRRDLGVADAAS